MSHSVPSDSSMIESQILVGPDLVVFDRNDLPIYATPETLWANAGHDRVTFGASLDRLLGTPEPVFVTEDIMAADHTVAVPALAGDSLVELANLADGLILPAFDLPLDDHGASFAAQNAGIDGSLLLVPHDPWQWDLAGTNWLVDASG